MLSVAPSLLLLITSFTKIFVVLSLTRNALGLQSVPPNQVLAGLSLFLSLFVMGPVLSKINALGIQPYLHGTKTQAVALHDGIEPLRQFMLSHTRPQEIALMLRAGNLPNPPTSRKLELTTLIPAFVLSELRSAMIIGFVVYIPFLIIDMVVSSSLMSLGMMMLPPVSVSLPVQAPAVRPGRRLGPDHHVPRPELSHRVGTMTDTDVIHLGLQVMLIAAKLAAPALVTALVIGFAVSLFQSATQIQEFTLAFVPKAIGVARRAAGLRALDAHHDDHLHPAAVRRDPQAARLSPHVLAHALRPRRGDADQLAAGQRADRRVVGRRATARHRRVCRP